MKKKRNNRPHGDNCNLKKIRTEKGESLAALSKVVDMAPSGILKIEDGYDPKLMFVIAATKHYGVPVEEIWPVAGREIAQTPKGEKKKCHRKSSAET